MREPRVLAQDPGQFALPDGSGDRFSGYGVIGLPFSTGHVLALRRVEASSAGAAYTSVWHRDPRGRWVFHQDVPPDCSCPRYFGAAISANVVEPIRIEWTDNRRFRVTVDAPGQIVWDVRLTPTPATRVMNAAASVMPSRWWGMRSVVSTMETAARLMLGMGHVNLTGCTPNGQVFTAIPRRVWRIAESHAMIRGVDAGSPAPLPEQARLCDFYLPQRGIFAIFTGHMECRRHQ
uniref:Uncharacterized protein n=1 Tax=Solibacter usitatus (strain Ellin6076) TaxID=234267 RepID=Q01W22_SOLUE